MIEVYSDPSHEVLAACSLPRHTLTRDPLNTRPESEIFASLPPAASQCVLWAFASRSASIASNALSFRLRQSHLGCWTMSRSASVPAQRQPRNSPPCAISVQRFPSSSLREYTATRHPTRCCKSCRWIVRLAPLTSMLGIENFQGLFYNGFIHRNSGWRICYTASAEEVSKCPLPRHING